MDVDKMDEYNRVKLIVEKAKYAKYDVHKGMEGIILGPKRNGYWLVYFDGKIYQDANGVYRTTEIDLGVLEEDLIVID